MSARSPLILQWDENFDIGADTGTPVSDDYQVPFEFTGKLEKLTLTIDRPKLSPEDIKKLTAAGRNNRASEQRSANIRQSFQLGWFPEGSGTRRSQPTDC